MNLGGVVEEHRAFPVLLLFVLVLVLTEPIVFRGHVATPVDLHTDYMSGQGPQSENQLPYLGDVVRVFIPKLKLHFRGDHAGWNSTWNPHTQLGKPTSHFGGYSKAYPLTYCLSFLTTDPYRLHALLSVLTVLLMNLFAYLLLRELGLHPAAAFAGAVGIGLNTRTAYWFGFAQFLAWVTWSLAVMWLSLRLIKRWHPLAFIGLVFSCYCLTIGARHQAVIRMAYLIVPFVLVMIMTQQKTWQARLRSLSTVAIALVLALALSLPLVLGFGTKMVESARMSKDFTGLIQANTNPFFEKDLGMLWNVFAFGNPSSTDYPMRTPAINFTPFFLPLIFVAFMTRARTRGWVFGAVFLGFLLMTISPTVHMFAIRYGGFGFSAARPLGGLYVPAFVFCAFGIDALLKDPKREEYGALWPLVMVAVATTVGILAVFAPFGADRVVWPSFALGLVLAGAAVGFVWLRSPVILYGACLVSVVAFSAPALVHRPADEVAGDSEVIRSIRDHTTPRHRFAKFRSARKFLPSNEEVLVDLRSIHTYDSLASVRYERLTEELSDQGMDRLGRNFISLDSVDKIHDDRFSYTGVSCILSGRELPLENWGRLPLGGEAVLHVAQARPSLVAHLAISLPSTDTAIKLLESLTDQPRAGEVSIERWRDNELVVRIQSSTRPTLLFVSSQYHQDWVAIGDGRRLDTRPVNGFYLGAEVPPGVSRVALRFQPFSRWAWAPLVFFALMFLLALVRPGINQISPRRAHPSRGRGTRDPHGASFHDPGGDPFPNQ